MEAEIKFEKEKIKGVAVVGSYLIDAARRLGVEITDESGRLGLDDSSAVSIKSGAEFLSAPTRAELEILSDERRRKGERLASQAKIQKAGEIVIVTGEKKQKEEAKDKNEEYRREFAELPLEKKIANLMQLEAIALGETFSFILNSPYKIFGKAMDVMAEFGLKVEDEAKKAARPGEHQTAETKGTADAAKKNQTETSAGKKTPRKKAAAPKKPEANGTTDKTAENL